MSGVKVNGVVYLADTFVNAALLSAGAHDGKRYTVEALNTGHRAIVAAPTMDAAIAMMRASLASEGITMRGSKSQAC